MTFETKYITADIKLSEFKGKLFKTEVMFEHHILVWFLSGETKIIQADATQVFNAGDIFLIPRNQLATVINYPKDGRSHAAVAMHLTQERLKDFYARHQAVGRAEPFKKIYSFSKHPLLESCLASLIPYFDLGENLPPDIAELKIEEAIRILRSVDKNVDGLLADFEPPGKINLTDFMERHYMFNMTLDRFAYLTGRSLATFRRDFKKSFNATPQNWLTKKRLELAHYQLSEKQRKASDVYMEAGFENLSHFSYAFKNQFGYSPNALLIKSVPRVYR
ncbi:MULTISPECIES: AraC family transcriptional regulator [unclassified Mucilaginibacter]|jgi:AraC-like DNA-binding protein|uniref:helix-turn-helix domain-containing protein n=1 Tax=unclassified Mucilaginibacter TaxID=2617802 RepID=UPI0008BA3530|nr:MULTISPECIES: AraC family transcriptional regulator [unclassified Mucilaginibacter]WDF80702.1 AraC family transcriptional regulator [Mucilaginibacter sp. KACC 22773]SEO71861.1 transcriptional regulator, AraC family [Mucilaginibacter sp. OK283]